MRAPLKPEDTFAVEPAGPVPYSAFQVFGIFLIAFFPLLAVVACGLRVYSRRLSTGLGWDDWLIFLAAALAVPQAVFATLYLRAGYWGIHDADIPPHPRNQGLFWSYLDRVFYSPILTLVKISVLLFLLKLGGTKTSVRLACRALMVLCIMQLFAFLPATIFHCHPIEYNYLGVEKGRCFAAAPFTVAMAATSILTDILTLVVPFVAFLDLKLNNRIRIALMTVFTLGALVTAISVLRLYFVIRTWYVPPATDDPHYSLGYTTTTIEVNLAIVTATIPALWPLARHWFPGVFDSMGINRPYMCPDIEVGYLSQPRGGQAAAAGQRAFRAKVRWRQHARQPSCVRPAADAGSSDTRTGSSHTVLEDVHRQGVFETTAGRRNRLLEKKGLDEDVLEDYHGIIRGDEIATAKQYHHSHHGGDDDDPLIIQKPPGSRTTTPSPGAAGVVKAADGLTHLGDPSISP